MSLEKISTIIAKHTKGDTADHKQLFLNKFKKLYVLPTFKDGLDLIVSKAAAGEAKFVINVKKNWDRLDGCCQTTQNSIYNKSFGIFVNKNEYLINIKHISEEVIIHEIAHALEKESGLDLNDDFRKSISLDMKQGAPANIQLESAINQLMKQEVKPYPKNQILGELLSRYFELLAMSKEVGHYGAWHFTLHEVRDFFVNTTKWVEQIFNANLKPKIDQKIAKLSLEGSKNLKLGQKPEFQEKVKSFHSEVAGVGAGKVSWSGNVDSNSRWLESYEKHAEEIEE